jgi:hypothetical protein
MTYVVCLQDEVELWSMCPRSTGDGWSRRREKKILVAVVDVGYF